MTVERIHPKAPVMLIFIAIFTCLPSCINLSNIENQVDKKVKKPNFNSRNIINENLAILEMEKTSVVYSYPILIGSIILQNSKVHMYNYVYKIYPRLFGDDYKVLYMDTDSIYGKLNMTHEDYVKILEKNKDVFGKDIG